MDVFTDGGPSPPRPAAVALGNFDGVHAGHQRVIADAIAAAGDRDLISAACVFEPHPRQVFHPEAPPFRLQSAGQRARALGALGLDGLFQLPFDAALSALTADEFSRTHLVGHMGARHVSVGADFVFGRNRTGNAETLRQLGAAFGFNVGVVDVVMGEAEKISSTAIRQALTDGRMDAAAAMLTRPWAIEGAVLKGFQRGRTIGFPTLNLALGDYARPRFGVYSVRVDLGDGQLRPGVANVGVKPTLGAGHEPLLEAHVFDFAGDLYGREIEADLIAFLRPERKFDGLDALKAQIAEDAAAARRLLA